MVIVKIKKGFSSECKIIIHKEGTYYYYY